MRASVALHLSAAVGAVLSSLAVALLIVAPSPAVEHRRAQPLPAGDDAPAFLLASVQPIEAPKAWRRIYHEVEHCAGKAGDYDAGLTETRSAARGRRQALVGS